MNYVCIFTRRVVITSGRDGLSTVNVRSQNIDCDNRAMAEAMAERLMFLSSGVTAEVGVKIWNGKGSIVVPLATIEQVAFDLRHEPIELAAE